MMHGTTNIKCTVKDSSLLEHDNLLDIFYVLLTVHLGIILVNNQLEAQFFFLYVYFDSLHVLSNPVLIIRRINSSFLTCILDGHLHRVTYTRCIDTTDSPGDEHRVA